MSLDPTPWPSRRRLRCAVCGAVVNVTDEELVGYALHGWPQCHREVMAYTEEPDPKGALLADLLETLRRLEADYARAVELRDALRGAIRAERAGTGETGSEPE